MKRLFLLAFAVLALSAVAMAEDRPIFDFYGGYTWQRMDYTQGSGINMPWGFGFSAVGYPTKHVGVMVDFSYSKKTYNEDASSSAYYVLVGPQFTARHGRFEPFVRGFAGFAHNRVAFSRESLAYTKFCYGAGGGIDIKCNDLVSIRAFQFDFIRQTDVLEGNVYRFGFGVVFHAR